LQFLCYEMRATTLCMGERLRAGVFRPCCKVFRYTTLVGALAERFGNREQIHAAGRLLRTRDELLTFAPRERVRNISVVPLQIEYLAEVTGRIYVALNEFTDSWPAEFFLNIGAMKSKGFGASHLYDKQVVGFGKSELRRGRLIVRIPDQERTTEALGVRSVLSPHYGYLFIPTSETSGVYVKSLFEGSEVVAAPFLLEERGETE